MPDHHIIKCTCGTVIAQCRCFDPAKRVEARTDACAACQRLRLQKLQKGTPVEVPIEEYFERVKGEGHA